ncbi:MAG: hypothetical protein ACJ8MH_00235 [Povalibacter sp.]
MSSPDSPTLALDLRDRRADSRCGLLVSMLAGLAPFLYLKFFPLTILLVCSLALFAVCGMGFRRADWFGSRKLARITWQPDGCWVLTDARGENYKAVLSPSSRMSPFALWLRWSLVEETAPSEKRAFTRRGPTLLLGRTDLAVTDFRRLLVRLRMDRSEWRSLATQIKHP